jgi:hypothetical protein
MLEDSRPRPVSRTEWGWLLLGVGIWCVLSGYATYYGLAMTSDSWNYLSATRSFGAIGELRNANGTLYTAWPPLFPVLLAAWADTVPLSWKWLQVGCLAGSLVVWGHLGQLLLTHNVLARLYVLVLAFSTPWLICAGFLWSEPVFVLLFSVYIYAVYRFGTTSNYLMLLLATLSGILLPLQRVSGFFVLAGVAVAAVALYPAQVWRRRALLLAHGVVVVSAGLVWQYYTLFVVESRNLQEARDWQVWVQAADDFGHAMGRWFLPMTTRAAQGHGVYAVLFLFLSIVGAFAPGPRFLRLLGIVVAVVLLPLVPLAWLRLSGTGLTDADRYTAVVYAPFFLLLFAQVQRLFPQPGSNKQQRLVWLLGLCWLLYPAARMVRNAHYLHQREPARISAPLAPLIGQSGVRTTSN